MPGCPYYYFSNKRARICCNLICTNSSIGDNSSFHSSNNYCTSTNHSLQLYTITTTSRYEIFSDDINPSTKRFRKPNQLYDAISTSTDTCFTNRSSSVFSPLATDSISSDVQPEFPVTNDQNGKIGC